MKSKEQKRLEAAQRAEARAQRTAREQLEILNAKGLRATRERGRLERETEPRKPAA